MSIERQIEREEEWLLKQFNEGIITREEFNTAMRDLQRDYRDAAHEAAREAYERELDCW